jgi:hypothetical protein
VGGQRHSTYIEVEVARGRAEWLILKIMALIINHALCMINQEVQGIHYIHYIHSMLLYGRGSMHLTSRLRDIER